MSRNWLIRTKSNHILGPVSKEKVLELFKNSSIKPDDEICSGNGHWFFVRETDLVERYLTGNEPQSFNPISEAKDVLTSSTGKAAREMTRDDITVVGGVNLNSLNAAKKSEADVPPPPKPNVVVELPKKKLKPDTEEKKSPNLSPITQTNVQVPHKKQSYLKYIGIIGFIALFLAVYYRKILIRTILGHVPLPSIELISSANAQEVASLEKKNF